MRIKYYIQSVDFQCWKKIEARDYISLRNKEEWTSEDKAEFRRNALAITLLHCVLSRNEFNRISMYSTAKEI